MEMFKKYLEETGEIGRVVGQSHYLTYVSGLPTLKLGEMVMTENEERGLVHGLGKETAEILMLGEGKLKIGQEIARTNTSFQIPVSQELLGRIINPLGRPIDDLGPILGEKEYLSIQREAPGITRRVKINKPLETGVMVVDLLVPIGYGQRELVIGDAKTGKTIFLLQTLSNQAKKGAICIYVAIGKEISAVKAVEDYLKEAEVFNKTVMVVATSENLSTINYLSPFSGMTIAEYFRDRGKKVLIILDDLTSHAKFYREISLLIKRLPGRSSYPGDIFHVQAALLERAGNIKTQDDKEVSITALPVAETLENDLSGFIQTNLMAMTDGHIFFDINDFRRGKLPAVNAFLSVSRVGNQTKEPLDYALAGWIRKKMTEYQRVKEIAQFGEELFPETQKLLDLGKKLETLFNQGPKTIIPRPLQLFVLGLLIYGFWEDKPLNIMRIEVETILKNYKEVLPEIEKRMEGIKNLEGLKSFAEQVIPGVKEVLYHPL
jgi:F-type H+-transporting ATPase subunit alpha